MSKEIENPNPTVYKAETDFSDEFHQKRKIQENDPDHEDPIDELEGNQPKSWIR